MRFRVRGLMVAVAVVAALLGIGLGIERERRRILFTRRAAECSAAARSSMTCAIEFDTRAARQGSHPINRRMAQVHSDWAAYFDRAGEQWQRAAARSWPSLAPEDYTSNPDPPGILPSEFPGVQFGRPFPP